MTQPPFDRAVEDRLPGEAALSDLYRSAAGETSPPTLDRTILAAAATTARASAIKRWAVPLSVAAVVVVTVSVVLRVHEHSPFEPPEPFRTTSDARAPAAPPMANSPEMERQNKAAAAPPSADRAAPFAAKREPAATQRAERRDDSREPALLSQASEAKRAGAEVVAVSANGTPGAYEFDVTVRSPDTGCAQYADWWEVVGIDGRLLYRRVLLHSHPDEQPFARSGGPVPIGRDTVVWVRVHMNHSGYGSIGFKGSVGNGFARTPLAPDFALNLQKQPPLPDGCAF